MKEPGQRTTPKKATATTTETATARTQFGAMIACVVRVRGGGEGGGSKTIYSLVYQIYNKMESEYLEDDDADTAAVDEDEKDEQRQRRRPAVSSNLCQRHDSSFAPRPRFFLSFFRRQRNRHPVTHCKKEKKKLQRSSPQSLSLVTFSWSDPHRLLFLCALLVLACASPPDSRWPAT